MVSCPNCSTAMASQALGTSIGTSIEAGVCGDCSLLWFDGAGSVRLAPQAVLTLFQAIGSAGGRRSALRASFACPRCHGPLAFTHDLQRTTHFTYWRCSVDHGQLIGFAQFLLEKNFVRAPSPEELARLRLSVRQISCSQCGAPIDLRTDSACSYCHAPVAVIDPDSVAKAVRELVASSHATPPSTAGAVSGSALGDAQIAAIFSPERIDRSGGHHDLLAIGVAAIGALLADWIG